MIKLMPITCVLCLLPFGSVCLATDIQLETGLSYEWWDSDSDYGGSQLAVPIKADYVLDDFSARLVSGFVSTRSDQVDSDSSLSSLVDTKLNFSYQWLDNLPVDIMVGLDFNLPTGKTDLSADELGLIVDPELVSITPFGEGLAVNPTVVIAKSWGNTAAGLGVGYAWRDKYDFSENVKNYDPGDILTLSGELRSKFTADLQGKLYVEYASFSEDKIDSVAVHENGDLMVMGIGADAQAGDWTLFADLHSVFRGKSKDRNGAEPILTESEKSNGDEIKVTLGTQYPLNQSTSLKAQTAILLIDANDYASDEDRYIGQKKKYSLDVDISKEFSDTLQARAGIGAFYMDSEKDWFHDENIKIKGLSLFVGATKKF